MRSLIAPFVVAALLVGCAGPSPEPELPMLDPGSLRRPPAGPVVGFIGEYGNHVWLGVPYAEPPVDALRWRAPALPPSRALEL